MTSNYRYDLAPYTWELVQKMAGKNAIFTQPGMPIKCAGAPQKAMYLSCDHWMKAGKLKDMNVSFCNAGPVLFGCAPYVPPLMKYVDKYGINLDFGHNLVRIDGAAKTAWFKVAKEGADPEIIERQFDMIHVCPPQCAPDFIRDSALANAGGWVDVDPATLQHTKFSNIFGLGDVTSTANAKTVAAARKQAPIVAANVIAQLAGRERRAEIRRLWVVPADGGKRQDHPCGIWLWRQGDADLPVGFDAGAALGVDFEKVDPANRVLERNAERPRVADPHNSLRCDNRAAA